MNLSIINRQPSEEQVWDSEGRLEIVSVFETIQGEGPFAGEPCVFVRLAGCNLRCPGCDTDYTSGRRTVSVETLIQEVRSKRPSGLVVITGGEPFRQRLTLALSALVSSGYRVQIESNGRLFEADVPPLLSEEKVTLVCSPKGPINVAWQPHLRHLKYVLRSPEVSALDGLPMSSIGYPFPPERPWHGFQGTVWLQPFDAQNEEENRAHRRAAIDSCLKHGYRLSLQTHKILGLP